jgi:hypothetical protein
MEKTNINLTYREKPVYSTPTNTILNLTAIINWTVRGELLGKRSPKAFTLPPSIVGPLIAELRKAACYERVSHLRKR